MKKITKLTLSLATAFSLCGTPIYAVCPSLDSIPSDEAETSADGWTVKASVNKQSRRYQQLIDAINTGIQEISKIDSLSNAPIIIAPKVTYDINEGDEGNPDVFEILALTIPFLFSFGIVWLLLWNRKDRFREKCRIIDKAIENDYILPDSFYAGRNYLNYHMENIGTMDSTSPMTRFAAYPKQLQSALIWMMVGLAGVIFFVCRDIDFMTVLCLLAFCIGASKIVTIYFSSKFTNNNGKD